MLRIYECLVCGDKYNPYRSQQRYCSTNCRLKGYRRDNPDRVKMWEANKQEKHKDKIKQRQQQYYKKNKDVIKKYKDKWYQENRERILERLSYLNSLKPKIKVRVRSKVEKRVVNNCRSRISIALQRNVGRKSDKTKTLIGCGFKTLMKHLEKQFVSGMSWNNYGRDGWSIDHIKPCKLFDLTKKEEQFKCFHYTNLQPLWHIDNLQKGDRYEMDKKE
jgi:hypothetical protein